MEEPRATRRPLSRMRKAIAKSMAQSALIPQFSLEADANMDAAAKLRSGWKADGVEISYADLIIAACARSLRVHSAMNSSFAEDAIVEFSDINIGVAVALPDGLIAPVIQSADRRSLPDLKAERERLTWAAESGTLQPDDVFSATFTVSNLGPMGVRRFRALVVPPQAAILAVGALTDDRKMSFTLSCDHRVLDGSPAAAFLMDVVHALESPDWTRKLVAPPAR